MFPVTNGRILSLDAVISMRDWQGVVRFRRAVSMKGDSLKGTKNFDDNEETQNPH